jgi:hypothetical protein
VPSADLGAQYSAFSGDRAACRVVRVCRCATRCASARVDPIPSLVPAETESDYQQLFGDTVA